jgi:predicted patatin/cPLA2 family phospholipase
MRSALSRFPDAAMEDPVLAVVMRRAESGSLPGKRSDGHVVSLAIEGGGMRGVVSAGMCAVLEMAGLVPAFDRIYGCSAGALTGCFTAAGQAVLWATTFEDIAGRELIDPARLLRRRPVLDLGFLFETVVGVRKPLSEDGLARGPALRALAVSAEDASLRVLGEFSDSAELLAAVRVSCTIPVIGGAPATYRGEAMLDGGLLEPIPYVSAVREGSSHVLVLRSRDTQHREPARRRVAELAVSRAYPQLRPLMCTAGARYNRDADALEALATPSPGGPAVTQVAVPPDSRLVGRLSTDRGRIGESLRLGATAMASALYGEPARLMWQPVPYGTHDPAVVSLPVRESARRPRAQRSPAVT